MAQKWSNQNLPGALHYITGNVLNRIPIFKQEKCCRAFLGECADLLHKWPCKLIAYVVMPDHFHLTVNPQDGDIMGFWWSTEESGSKKDYRCHWRQALPAREARQRWIYSSGLAGQFQGISSLE